MLVYVMFALMVVILVGAGVVVWRLWNDYAQISPEDIEFERHMASLNDRQANRMSDKRLVRPIDTDTGWRIMVRRGLGSQAERKRPVRRRRKP